MYFSCSKKGDESETDDIYFICFSALEQSARSKSSQHLSKHQEIKIAAELVSKAIVSDEDFIWKKSSYQLHYVLINFAKAKLTLARTIKHNFSFTQKSVKYYLLFRVLRN